MPTVKHYDWSKLQPAQKPKTAWRFSKKAQRKHKPKPKHKSVPRAIDKTVWQFTDTEVTARLMDIGRL